MSCPQPARTLPATFEVDYIRVFQTQDRDTVGWRWQPVHSPEIPSMVSAFSEYPLGVHRRPELCLQEQQAKDHEGCSPKA